MNTGRYNIRSLFSSSEIEQIIIPEIQRDYVWNENNVSGLMRTILDHFKAKATLTLEIIDQNKQAVNQDIRSFLSEEYTRIVYSTRIGFIYAYHSQDYPGKYFLIDGQQRLTTIFLLHLYAYKKAQMCNDYRQLFFKDNQPKIDYKVREISHDFLVDFILHEITNTDVPFTQSNKFYDYYNSDVTTRSMLRNYACIESMLSNCIMEYGSEESFFSDLVQYIEYYIEFNYFDTNISEQGERLYLYMNSRGETLSVQESLRPILIARSEEKLKAGETWEKWQNYFWKHKANNPNADRGFQEFLRWATFLHICMSDNPILYNQKNNNETKQDYIRIEKKDEQKFEQQKRWIKEYQENNQGFTIEFIDQVFNAVDKLKQFTDLCNYSFISNQWLSVIDNTNDYPTILSCLAYLMYYPDSTDLDVMRVGMFIKNCMYYDTNRKNPEMACVNVVNTIMSMHQKDIRDIIDLPKINIGKQLPKNIIIEADKHKAACARTMSRTKWEELFWTITDDKAFSSFLDGDTLCLFEWAEYDPNRFDYYYQQFKNRIIKVIKSGDKRQNVSLHEKLLEYGDFAIWDGYGNRIPRYYMLCFESEWARWTNTSKHIKDILKKYLDNEVPSYDGELYQLLIDKKANNKKSVLHYTEYLEILKSDEQPHHVILPRIYQISGDNYRELMTQWVHQEIKDSWVYQTNVVVIEFDLQEVEGVVKIIRNLSDDKKVVDKAYHIDMIYEWNGGHPYWSFKIGTRGKDFHDNIPSIINNLSFGLNKWVEEYNNVKEKNDYYLRQALEDDVNLTIHERVQNVITFVDKIWDVLRNP